MFGSEGELQILKNDFDTCHNQFENLLFEHVQVNTTNKRKKEIEKVMIPLDAKSKSLIENTSRLENDLNKVKDKRKQFALARDIIENYILQGKTLSESEGAVHDVASSSKEVSEKQQPATENDELNQYLGDIYKMYENHQTDDEMYKAMQAYTTIGLEKIHSTNKIYMREYEQHLNEKARMDMRVGRKPKNYHKVVGLVQKYKNEYAFVKRTQLIVEKMLKERQTTFTLDKCIFKYGEIEGQKIFRNRQEKWQETLNKNNDKIELNKKRGLSKEKFIEKHGQEMFNKSVELKKFGSSKEGLIENYGLF